MAKLKFDRLYYNQYSKEYIPIFTVEDGEHDELYERMELIGEKDTKGGFYTLYLYRSKNEPHVHRLFLRQNQDNFEHNKGYTWSTTESLVNATFGCKIMEVYVQTCPHSQCCGAVDVEFVQACLPAGYEIREKAERDGPRFTVLAEE